MEVLSLHSKFYTLKFFFTSYSQRIRRSLLNNQEASVASVPKAFLEGNPLRFLNTILWLLEYNPMAETLTCFWITIENLTRVYKKVPFTILQILPSPSGRCCVSTHSEAFNKENTGLCSLMFKTLLYCVVPTKGISIYQCLFIEVYINVTIQGVLFQSKREIVYKIEWTSGNTKQKFFQIKRGPSLESFQRYLPLKPISKFWFTGLQ